MYVLHFAPDNASLAVRIALEELGAPYEARLVDRARRGQRAPGYLALSPGGTIPVLEIDGAPVFETAAILLALAERHGALAPAPGVAGRAAFLSWLFFLSNTLHAELRLMFYPERYAEPPARAGFDAAVRARFSGHVALAEARWAAAPGPYLGGAAPGIADIYLAVCLRWAQLYPQGAPPAFTPAGHPALARMMTALQSRPATARACRAEGIAPPFLVAPTPPDGSAGAAL